MTIICHIITCVCAGNVCLTTSAYTNLARLGDGPDYNPTYQITIGTELFATQVLAMYSTGSGTVGCASLLCSSILPISGHRINCEALHCYSKQTSVFRKYAQ